MASKGSSGEFLPVPSIAVQASRGEGGLSVQRGGLCGTSPFGWLAPFQPIWVYSALRNQFCAQGLL